jgi:hypothetical protein
MQIAGCTGDTVTNIHCSGNAPIAVYASSSADPVPDARVRVSGCRSS